MTKFCNKKMRNPPESKVTHKKRIDSLPKGCYTLFHNSLYIYTKGMTKEECTLFTISVPLCVNSYKYKMIFKYVADILYH